MSLKLHYVPQTRAGRVRFVLEELGVPFELLRMEAKDTKSPEYLKVNPLGHVPALVDGDTTVIESAAICMYLADKFPEKKLAPPPGTPERAAYYQWIVYAMVTMEPVLVVYGQHTLRFAEADRSKATAEWAKKRFEDVAAVVDAHVKGREFIVGSHFTVADVVMAGVVGFGRMMGLMGGFPNLDAYAKGIYSREAGKKARAD